MEKPNNVINTFEYLCACLPEPRWGFLVIATMIKSLAKMALAFSWALRAGAGAEWLLRISFAKFWTSAVFLLVLEFPAFAAPNAMWIKQDGSVELTEIVGETSDAYMLTVRLPSGVGKTGVSKSQIAFCSMSARNWTDLCRAILRQKQPALFDRIAAYYATPRTAIPPGALDVPVDAALFNQLPENLRRSLVKLALRESYDVATNARAMEEAVEKYEAKVQEARRQAPESSEAQKMDSQQSKNPLDGSDLTSTRPAHSPQEQAKLRAEAHKKAIDAFYPALLADLSFPVSALLLAEAPEVINDFQARRLIKATHQGFPIPNRGVIAAYHLLALANILGADLHRPETSIVFPRLEDQDLFDPTNNNVRMANDGKYGHLELVDAGNGEIFLSSPIIPAGPTLSTHTLCLADMDPAMKQFFASEAAKSGKFLLLAARLSSDVEQRKGIWVGTMPYRPSFQRVIRWPVQTDLPVGTARVWNNRGAMLRKSTHGAPLKAGVSEKTTPCHILVAQKSRSF
ncbi:MAG TPA: hypothetical protein VGM54_13740 [Chthoniobacter sp.]